MPGSPDLADNNKDNQQSGHPLYGGQLINHLLCVHTHNEQDLLLGSNT